jgi:antitoxin (DNA-binding transcriptional repressor) of toxin-antitoxin stability system
MWHIMCHVVDMPSVNIRQLRDTKRLKAWLRAGKTVELRERDQIIAKIVPEAQKNKTPAQWPDFAARAKEVLGDQILPNVVLEDRGRY